MTRRRVLGVAAMVLAAWAVAAAHAGAATRYDSRLRFRTLRTPRFDIHFHQGEEGDARRLAALAEDVAAALDGTLGPPSGRVQVVLVNQDDLPNGWATPLPYNLIEIRTASPGGVLSIAYTDDWLRLVFTHEYTHAVHLSRGRGWIGDLRRVFGRHPLLFPNLVLPAWQIEGLAVYEESALTGLGRIPAGDFHEVLRTAALAGRFDPIDRVSGGLDDWPRGQAPYVYGGYFHAYLADRFGAASLRALTDATAALPPFLGARAYRRVFGAPLGRLWQDYAGAESAAAAPRPDAAARLTTHGFTVDGPRVGPEGAIYYAVSTPHGFPAIMRVPLDGGPPRRVASRYLGARLGVAGDTLVFDQAEVHAGVALQFDLYAHDLATGRTTRLTRGARAADPDVSPDGRTIVGTVQRDGQRDLVLWPYDAAAGTVGDPRVLAGGAGQAFNAPRFSPDGRWIAAERRVAGRLPAIVIVEVASGAVRELAAAERARFVTPAWQADGGTLLAAADLDGGPFSIVAVDVASGLLRRLEGTGRSAQAPEVTPDGRTLIYVGYTADGYDLFTLALDGARWTPASVAAPRAGAASPRAPVAGAAAPVADEDGRTAAPYAPWRMLAPRFWTPVAASDAGETVVGAATAMADPLGRHVLGVEAGWAAARGRPDWGIAYAYDRWWPTFFAAYDDDTDPWQRGEARSQELSAGAIFPIRTVRVTQSLLAGVYGAEDRLACADCARPVDVRQRRRALRAGYSVNTSRLYGYSISREDGSAAAVTAELTRQAWGADGNAGSAVVDLRRYQAAWPPHGVVAVRVAAAHAWGDAGIRRRFRASGDGSQPGGFRFASDAIGLVRGFDDDAPRTTAAVVNLDYRAPLWRIQRGWGTWPLFARALHGAIFADLGHAWDARPRLAEARRSFGIELSLDAVVGHSLPVTLTAGAAWRHDGRGDRDVTCFSRIGRAF